MSNYNKINGNIILNNKETINVYLFNSDKIRYDKNFNINFTIGGNHFKWKCILENEIWIEIMKSEEYIIAIFLHEVYKRIYIKYLKLNYNSGHNLANSFEISLRYFKNSIIK